MPTITLFRHGRDDDAYRGGWSQRGLVAEGFRQSAALGAYLARNRERFPCSVLLSSDLRRARETAEEIANAVGVAVEYAPEWRETNNGVLAGMLNSEALERFPGLYWNTLRMDQRYPGGESPAEFFDRVREAFEGLSSDMLSGARPADIGIVTHGGVINAIYHLAKGLPWSNSKRGFPAGTTSVHQLVYEGGRWSVTVENLRDHLGRSETGWANDPSALRKAARPRDPLAPLTNGQSGRQVLVGSSIHGVMVRRATSADSAIIAELTRVSNAEYSGRWQVTALSEGTEDVLRDLETGAGFVAEAEGACIGAIRCVPGEDASTCHLQRLAVTPGWRGRGIARVLMATAEEHARSTGASRISLNTVSDNVLLTRFYESLSYGITMTEPVRGKTYAAHTWIKTLRP